MIALKKQMPKRVYETVFDRAEDVGYPACEAMVRGVCSGRAVHWHHRQLRSQGGGHTVPNGLAVCDSCHRFFHANPAKAYRFGWIVRSIRDPAFEPVLRRGRWVRLGESGEVVEQ